MHSYRFTPGDTVVSLPLLELGSGQAATSLAALFPAWEYALAYGFVALLLAVSARLRPGTGR
jgi:hypothetical protein